jgi:surface antigen
MRALGFLLIMTLLAGGAAVAATPAGADTLGYPNATAAPYRPSAPDYEWWVDENHDGRRQLPDELISARGYYYRNATDYVAWKLQSLGVSDTKTRDLHSAGEWVASAGPRAGVSVRDFPSRHQVAVNVGNAGHVAFIEDVLPDGRITVTEYNAGGSGVGRTWTGTPASRGFTKYLDFGLSTSAPGSPLALARNADGRLEVFAVANSGATFHTWQASAGRAWSDWSAFDGNLAHVAADTNADGRLEVFGVTANGTLFHKWQQAPGVFWSSWAHLEGRLDNVAIARNRDGRLEAFGTNSAHNVYHQWQLTPGGTWSGWKPFDGGLSDVAAETNADGRIELFGVTANGAIFHRSQIAPGAAWTAWGHISGVITSLAVARNRDGRLEMFGSDASHAVFHKRQVVAGGNDWGPWSRFDGSPAYLAAETNADGRIELFGATKAGAISHRWQLTPGGAWSEWVRTAGGLPS